MPIYEYECKECELIFEKFFKTFKDAENVKCEFCNSENVEKIPSQSNFHLKGQGFYQTDYRNNNNPLDIPGMKRKSNITNTDKILYKNKKKK